MFSKSSGFFCFSRFREMTSFRESEKKIIFAINRVGDVKKIEVLSFFKNFQKSAIDFKPLVTDMHSHLIAGIDDGAKTLQKSVQYVEAMIDLGFQKIITTPHVMGDHYPNTPEIILAGLEELRTALKKKGISIPIDAAAEYYVDDFFVELLDSNTQLLTLPGNRLLIEFSTFAPPSNGLEIIFRLKTMGYQPVLAHPERYVYYAEQFSIFEKLKSMGCELQLNVLSPLGHYGVLQKKLANQLLKKDLIDFVGTDIHHGGHLDILRKPLKISQIQFLKNPIFKNTDLF